MPFRPGLGISDFCSLRESDADYVDKTRFVVDVIQDPAQILLLPRPRRFGKTLNLSTLRYFFETSDQDRVALFEGLEVWDSQPARAHFQRHPVLWPTFKDVKFNTWSRTFAGILRVARESVFSGLNNLIVYSLLSIRHASSFGFTEEEVNPSWTRRRGRPSSRPSGAGTTDTSLVER